MSRDYPLRLRIQHWFRGEDNPRLLVHAGPAHGNEDEALVIREGYPLSQNVTSMLWSSRIKFQINAGISGNIHVVGGYHPSKRDGLGDRQRRAHISVEAEIIKELVLLHFTIAMVVRGDSIKVVLTSSWNIWLN